MLRAGLIAASIYNVNRKKGSRAFQPDDFIRKPPKLLSPEQMYREFSRWAKTTNQTIRKGERIILPGRERAA